MHSGVIGFLVYIAALVFWLWCGYLIFQEYRHRLDTACHHREARAVYEARRRAAQANHDARMAEWTNKCKASGYEPVGPVTIAAENFREAWTWYSEIIGKPNPFSLPQDKGNS